MNTVRIGVAALGALCSVALFGCPNPDPATGEACGSAVCGEGQVCDTSNLLCVDDVAPKVTIDSPKAGDKLTGESVEVTGTVIDDAGKLARTEASVEGGEWAEVKVGDGGKFTATVPLPKLDSKGTKLRVRAFDELEQEGVADVEVTVDNVGPACSFVAPADGAFINVANGPTYDVKFQIDDASAALQAVSLKIDGTETTMPLPATLGQGSYTWTLDSTDNDVAHTLALHVVDAAGNACDAQVTVRVDLVVPELVLSSPADMPDPFLVGGPGSEALTFEGSASDGSQRPAVTIDFDDGAGPREVEWAMTGNDFTLEVPLPVDDDFKLHQAVIRAVDAAGNSFEITRNIRVDRVPPTLAITFPTDGQNFNIAAMAGGDVVTVTWNSADGDDAYVTSVRQLPSTNSTPVSAGVFPVQTLATDNGKTYEVEITAEDSAGNTNVQTVSFNVDRVAPKVTSGVPANNLRGVDADLKLTFSEPVTFQTGATVFTPSVALPTQSASTFTIPLLHYQTYALMIPAGMVLDSFGNPNVSAAGATFQTTPAAPNPSTFALVVGSVSGDNKRFEATSDEDGVVTIAYRTSGGLVEYGEIDPLTGSFTPLDSCSSSSIGDLVLSSHRELSVTPPATAALTPLRYRGFSVRSSGSYYASWVQPNGTVIQQSPATEPAGIVPLAAGCDDAPGDPVAYINSAGELYREGSGSGYVETGPFTTLLSIAGHSRDAWAAAGYTGTTLKVSERRCYCSQFASGCSFGPTFQMPYPADKRAKLVVPGNKKFVVATWYSVSTFSGGPYDWCVRACGEELACPSYTPQYGPRPLNDDLQIATHTDPDKIIGSRHNNSGALELLERQVLTGCFDDQWHVLATAPSNISAAATNHLPLMFGNKPGVLYLDNTSTLKVWIP